MPYVVLEKRIYDYVNGFGRRSVLINSFWGLDKAESLPPNFVHTGPLTKPPGSLMEDFKKKDIDLFEWMNKAQQEKRDVVLITLGSECKW